MSAQAHRYFLEQIEPEWLEDRYTPKVRTIREQFTHIHNVRLMWLKASAPELMEGLHKFEKEENPDAATLIAHLAQSAEAIGKLLDQSAEKDKVKNWKGPAASFLAYIVAHEGYHRGLASASLRNAGHKLSQSAVFGQWEWGKFIE